MATSQRAILRRYALWGGLAFVVVSLAVAALVASRMQAMMVDGTAKMVASGMAGFVGEAYSPGEFARRDATAHKRLEAIMAHRATQGTVYAMRVIAPDGTIVFSSDPAEEGRREVLTDRQRSALYEGSIASTLGSALTQDGSTLLSVVGPVTMTPDGKRFAIVEASRLIDPVASGIQGAVVAVALTVLAGGLASYLLVYYVLKRATDEMESTAQEMRTLSWRLAESVKDLEDHSLGTLQSLVAAVDAKDSYTARHSLAVADYALVVGARMGLTDDLALLERAALLHDVGKLGVPEAVLLKQGRLLEVETNEIRRHSAEGAQIIEMVPFLRDAIPIIRHHHERWDGDGYPDRLAGPEIPLLARILAVADALDAMVSDRPYRPAQTLAFARAEIESGAGSQFDPVISTALIGAIDAGEIHPEHHHPSAHRIWEAS